MNHLKAHSPETLSIYLKKFRATLLNIGNCSLSIPIEGMSMEIGGKRPISSRIISAQVSRLHWDILAGGNDGSLCSNF